MDSPVTVYSLLIAGIGVNAAVCKVLWSLLWQKIQEQQAQADARHKETMDAHKACEDDRQVLRKDRDELKGRLSELESLLRSKGQVPPT